MSNQPKKIDEMLREFGFRTDAPESTARALIINLVRSAYGPEVARQFIREMNSSVKPIEPDTQFQDSAVDKPTKKVMEEQLSLFDLPASTPVAAKYRHG